MKPKGKIHQILKEMTIIFDRKNPRIDLRIQLNILPDLGSWSLTAAAGKATTIKPGPDNSAQIILKLHAETLDGIHDGEMTGLTAAGRENIKDETPLDFELPAGKELTPALMTQMIEFIQRFFNPTYPEHIQLDKAHARLVHGGFAIPMFYDQGFRSAWYELEKGQQLNEPGDTNPFPQAFIIIAGKGFMKIGSETLSVQTGQAYYIPSETEHIVWTESDQPLRLIFLAWGQKA
jgi:mannose-6-phosphate isomerase-like protein (cupin superfamily)